MLYSPFELEYYHLYVINLFCSLRASEMVSSTFYCFLHCLCRRGGQKDEKSGWKKSNSSFSSTVVHTEINFSSFFPNFPLFTLLLFRKWLDKVVYC